MQVLEAAVAKTFGEWFRPVAHAETVVQILPVWAKARTLKAICAVNRQQLSRLATQGKVAARQLDGNVVYKVADVLAAIEAMPSRSSFNNNETRE